MDASQPSRVSDQQVDELLRQRLGSGQLTAEQRRSHRRLIATFGDGQTKAPSTRHAATRLTIALVTLTVVVLAIVSGWPRLPRSSAPPSGVAAAKQMFSWPSPGTGRYLRIQGRAATATGGETRAWTTDIWQRTQDDGTVQTDVEATESSGKSLGRYVQSGDNWSLKTNGMVTHGRGTPMSLPPEISNVLTPPETFLAMLSAVDPKQVTQTRVADQLQLTIDVPQDQLDSDPEIEQLLGVRVVRLQTRLILSADEEQLKSWELVAIDENGIVHLVYQYTFTGQREESAEALGNSHFVLDTEANNPPVTPLPTFPERIVIPKGALQLSSKSSTGPGTTRVIMIGPGSLVLQLAVEPSRAAPLQAPWPDPQRLDTGETTVLWSAAGPQADFPQLALWDDGQHRFDLSISNVFPGGWTTSDLATLVNVLSAWDRN